MEPGNSEKSSKISRREFIKLAAISPLAFTKIPDLLQGLEDIYQDKESGEKNNQLIAYNAIVAATRDFSGQEYSWNNEERYHCSGFVAQYFKHLGYPVARVVTEMSQYNPKKGDPLPDATTVKQVRYLKMIQKNYGKDLAAEPSLKEILSNKNVWKNIPAGSVLYLPESVGHHGYDTFTHTAIFMGLSDNKEPLFSEFSVYMKNGPEFGHGFDQFARMYRGKRIEPHNPENGELKVFIFDAVKGRKRIKETRKKPGSLDLSKLI